MENTWAFKKSQAQTNDVSVNESNDIVTNRIRIPPPSDTMKHHKFLQYLVKAITALFVFILNSYTSRKNDSL